MGQFIPDGFGQATVNLDFIAGPSNPMAIVHGYDYLGAPDPSANAVTIKDRWETFVTDTGMLSNNVTLISVSTIENPGGVTGLATSGAIGNRGDGALPPQVSILIRKSSLTGGRRGRGRMYVPGPTINQSLEGGYLDVASLAVLQAGASALLSGLAADLLPMVILHDDGGATIPSGVTLLVVQPTFATQRRRIRA